MAGTPRGNRTSVQKWLNTTGGTLQTTTAYYDTGMPYSVTDPAAHSTTFSYSSAFAGAYVTQTTMPATGSVQHIVSGSYDFNTGKLTSFTDQNGSSSTSTYAYDSLARMISASFPDGGLTTNCYSDFGGSTCAQSGPPYKTVATSLISSGLNKSTTTNFDGLGRVTQKALTTDPDGSTYTVTTYDPLGRVSQVYNPTRCATPTTNCGESTWGFTTTQYDALNRITSVTEQDSSVVTSTYAGNCVTVTDEASKVRKSCSDALGRLTQVFEDPSNLNYLTAYSYDAVNNLTNVTQAGSRARTFVYNSLSELLTATNPESGAITYTYDNDGNVLTKVDARAIKTTYSYDALNRLTQKSYSDGTPTATFLFDSGFVPGGATPQNTIGRLVTAQTPITDSAFSYDTMGRVVWNVQATPQNCCATGWTFNYSYDLMGDMLSSSTGFGTTFSYTYDGAARPKTFTSSLVDAQHPAAIFTPDPTNGYFPNGALRKANLGNGLTETNMYNNRLQPCLMEMNSANAMLQTCNDGPPSGDIMDLLIGYNSIPSNNGDVTRVYATGAQYSLRSYTYDSLNRLSSMSDTVAAQSCKGLSWTYDAWGNRTDQTVTSGTCNTFHNSVDTNNRFVGAPYQYDASGNMTHDASHSYTYNAENRVTAVDSGSTANYYYDAQGYRVHHLVGTSTMEYLYDLHGNVIAEILPSGGLNAFYMYLGGKQVAEYYNLTTYFIHQDHLGSTRLLAAMDKSIFDSMDYLPFGEQIAGASGTTHKFTGKERDTESGLDNFGARYNTSTMGRFMSPDPSNIGVDRRDPQSWNAYSYTLNNPLSLTDPTGLYVCEDSTSCNSQNDQNFAKSLADAQTAANNLTGDDKAAAQRAIGAYGAQGVDNGVNVRFDGNISSGTGVTEVSGVANGNKSTDNPTGQNINVTFNPDAVGKDQSAGLVAHEGSHVADGSDWVKSGFSANMDPTHNQTEMNANHVQFNIMNAQLGALYPNGYTAGLYNKSVKWNKGDTFKMITPDLQKAIQKANGADDTKPAFTKGWRLQP